MFATKNDGKERVFTGRHMLIVMLGFFGTVIGVNVIMAVLAAETWTGLVVKNGYVASQHYNEVLAAAHEQKALGWKPTLSYAGRQLVFTLFDRDARPVHVTETRVRISRPTHEGEDQQVDLVPTARTYEADVELGPGVWNAEVTARRSDGGAYRAQFRLIAKAKD